MKVAALTVLALIAFALNSILCRLALRGEEADAAGFTAVRLISGAAILVAISYFVGKLKTTSYGTANNPESHIPDPKSAGWLSAVYLFAYAICFSLAYLNLTAGTGALILFGSVQLTMVAVSISRGDFPNALEWLGLVAAVGGLVYLVLPALESPPLNSSLLMAVAGAAWGFYSLRGRGSSNPTRDTAGNFVRTLPFALIAAAVFWPNLKLTSYGASLAVISGAVTSGIGYAIWYTALRDLTATRAAVVQLAVPVIAAAIGVVFLAETASSRLVIATALILGGIGLTIFGRRSISVARA